MLTILLTSCGAQTSPSIIEALRNNGEQEVRIIGVDSNEEVPGKYLVDKFYKVRSSIIDPEGFIEDIQELDRTNEIDVFYPCGNEDCLELGKNQHWIFPMVINEFRTLEMAFDKLYVYNLITEKCKRNAPKFGNLIGVERKFVVKPRFGKGGRGVYIVDKDYKIDFIEKPKNIFNPQMIKRGLEKIFKEHILMEYLSGDIYSVYCLCNHGETLWTGINKRIYGNASNTLTGMTVQYREIEECVKILNKEFEFHYSVNYEFAEDENGVPKLFDLNPRSAASTGVFINQGINLPWLTVKQALGIPLKNIPPAKIGSIFLRYLKELYV